MPAVPKMADEQTKPPLKRPEVVPFGLDWQSLLDADGPALEPQYLTILNEVIDDLEAAVAQLAEIAASLDSVD